jgi:hypothetical protein
MVTSDDKEDCCKPVAPTGGRRCPSCGKQGKRVSRLTVSVFVRDPRIYLHPELLPPGDYSMCETRTCSVVYFNSHSESAIGKDDLRVKVWQKEDNPSVPACYCFNNSVKSITKEIELNGTTDVLARINKEVKAGNCRCEVTNPQGSCCLGNIAKPIRVAKELASPPTVV